jgi:hypothetical protein
VDESKKKKKEKKNNGREQKRASANLSKPEIGRHPRVRVQEPRVENECCSRCPLGTFARSLVAQKNAEGQRLHRRHLCGRVDAKGKSCACERAGD